jgi:hypothetical protein
MQELNFDHILKWINHVEPNCRSLFNSELSSPITISSPEDFESIWNQFINIIDQLIPSNTKIVKNWKCDLFMSIYAAFSYSTPGLLPLTSKTKIADTVSQQANKRKLLSNLKSLRETYSNELFWQQYRRNTDLEYFKSVWDTQSKFKIFDNYDFYYYLDNFKNWPFYYKNENGFLICNWYSFINGLFNIISNYNEKTKKDKFDKNFSYYLFEQFFYPCRFVSTLSKHFKISSKYFYDIDNPYRERSIILTTFLAELPSHTTDYLLDNFSSTLLRFLELKSTDEQKNYKPFYEKLFSFVRYSFCYFPLCQTLLANLIYNQYHADLSKKTSQKKLQEDLRNYITTKVDAAEKSKDYSQYNYKKLIETSLKSLEEMTYPLSGRKNDAYKNLTQKYPNNFPIESFNHNFTYYFYLNASNFNCFDLIIKQKDFVEKNDIKNNHLPIDSIREATVKKTKLILQSMDNINNSYTYNLFMAKNPNFIISD